MNSFVDTDAYGKTEVKRKEGMLVNIKVITIEAII